MYMYTILHNVICIYLQSVEITCGENVSDLRLENVSEKAPKPRYIPSSVSRPTHPFPILPSYYSHDNIDNQTASTKQDISVRTHN